MKSIIAFIAFLGVISASELTLSSVGFSTLANAMCPAKTNFDGVVIDPEALWNPFVDIFNGIIEGVKQTFASDLDLFTDCISCPPQIWAAWVEFYNYVKNMKSFNLSEFFDKLMEVVMDTIGAAMPCVILGMILDKFVELILNPTWENLQYTMLKTLAANAQLFFNDLIAIVTHLFKGEFFVCGEYIGNIAYVFIIH